MDSNSELELGLTSRGKRPYLQEGVGEKEDELVDRISDLPYHILAQVLSFLEIDEAVRTSILSSRWRYLWKGVTCVCLSDHEYGPVKCSHLVEHVLQECSSTNFLRFELNCPLSMDISRINTWIGCIKKSHNIEELRISVNNTDDYDLPESPLPQCNLSWSTLVVLKLDCFDIETPESIVSFPCLKSLDLQVIFPNSEAAVNWLLSCCPVLEDLDLFRFLDSIKVLKIDISVSTPRSLNLQLKNAGNSYKRKHDIC